MYVDIFIKYQCALSIKKWWFSTARNCFYKVWCNSKTCQYGYLLRQRKLAYKSSMLLESKGKVYLLIIFIFSFVVFFYFCLSSILPKGNFRRLNAYTTVRVVVNRFWCYTNITKKIFKQIFTCNGSLAQTRTKTICLICSFIDIMFLCSYHTNFF